MTFGMFDFHTRETPPSSEELARAYKPSIETASRCSAPTAACSSDRGNSAQPRDDLSGVVELTHIGVAGGEKAIRLRVAWILLDREKELRHCPIEAPSEEMRGAYYRHRCAAAGAGTEA
jgi:hypothetical protein